jgi:hypothetical protein
MRHYLVDEISPTDMDKIKGFLRENAIESGIEGLFWVGIPEDHLNDRQSLHMECRPHKFALETGNDWIKAELFIRSSDNIKCECSGYCTAGQKNFILDYVENIIDKLTIKT